MALDSTASVRVAGDRLGSAADLVPGAGTFLRGTSVYASISGAEHRQQSEQGKVLVDIVSTKTPSLLPRTGDLVLAQVSRVSARVANADIVAVNAQTVRTKFSGIVRQQDVRSTEVDKVEMHKCFRPGDIILARLLSPGDSRAYYLSTAGNELGVVYAKSMAGAAMVPVSWQEMVCPLTQQKEPRKVAKTQSHA